MDEGMYYSQLDFEMNVIQSQSSPKLYMMFWCWKPRHQQSSSDMRGLRPCTWWYHCTTSFCTRASSVPSVLILCLCKAESTIPSAPCFDSCCVCISFLQIAECNWKKRNMSAISVIAVCIIIVAIIFTVTCAVFYGTCFLGNFSIISWTARQSIEKMWALSSFTVFKSSAFDTLLHDRILLAFHSILGHQPRWRK